MAGVPAEGEGEVPGEEGQPAHQEGAHHHPQRHERLEIGALSGFVRIFVLLSVLVAGGQISIMSYELSQ